MNDIVAADGAKLAQLIASRAVSCREVMTAFLDRIEAVNPSVNAIVALQPRNALLAQADERDQQLSRGVSCGWMHGFPLAVKDLAHTAGIVTTLGSPIFRNHVPAADSLVVERMKRAGAIVIGKTNTPEFGLGSNTYNTVYGVTRNPYEPSCSAGGSSGGAAVALALRMLPVADGSDMGGSLRNPAGWNNIFGFRPSFGRVPKLPEFDVFGQQLGVEGPMARSAADLAQLLAIQGGHDRRSPLSLGEDPSGLAHPLEPPRRGLRIGWLGSLEGHLALESGVTEVCEDALQTLVALGCEVEPARLGFDAERLWQAWIVLRSMLAGGALSSHYLDPKRRDLLKPEAVWEVEQGLRRNAHDIYRASVARSDWYRAALSLLERYDILALPSAQVFPFDLSSNWPSEIAGRAMDTYHRWMEVVIPATMAGLPAASVPAGFGGARGLPMGLQLIGKPRGDLQVLQLAHAYDRASDWVRRAPPPEPLD
ncbi:MAG: amidase [Betaproteobacteria bacterium]